MKADFVAQYSKALLMLAECIAKCPVELWNDAHYTNPYWRVVYHALFYTDLYLSADDKSYTPWEKHLSGYNFLGDVNFINNQPLEISTIYTKEELAYYAGQIRVGLTLRITENWDLDSGFHWLPMTRAGLHMYNLRHLQHHTGQLVERLRHYKIAVQWR